MRLVIAVLALANLANLAKAQTTPVVPLTSADAAMVASVHQHMLEAEKAWSDLQTDIQQRYLLVSKDDPDASDVIWYEDNKVASGILSISGTISSITKSSDNCGCSLAETKDSEKLKREEAERVKLETERQAKARRVRKGWEVKNCYGCAPLSFEFSKDFKFLVPKHEEPKPAQFQWYSNPMPAIMPAVPMSTWSAPGTSTGITSITPGYPFTTSLLPNINITY